MRGQERYILSFLYNLKAIVYYIVITIFAKIVDVGNNIATMSYILNPYYIDGLKYNTNRFFFRYKAHKYL